MAPLPARPLRLRSSGSAAAAAQSRGSEERSWRGISPHKIADQTLNSSEKKAAEGFDLLFEYGISTPVKVNEHKEGGENFSLKCF